MSKNEYPLAWPDGWPRTPTRKAAQFKSYGTRISFSMAEKRVRDELRLMGFDEQQNRHGHIIRRLDQCASRPRTERPGRGSLFPEARRSYARRRHRHLLRASNNVAALAATLEETLRAIERHGGAQIIQERAFVGFDALPPPGARPWRQVMGLQGAVTLDDVEVTYRALARRHHPDNGGDAGMIERA